MIRGKWWLLAAAAIGGVVGYLIGKFVIQHKYEASGTIQYVGLPGQQGHEVQRDQPGLVTAAHSDAVLEDIRERMPEMREVPLVVLRALIVVNSDTGSGLITFTSWGTAPDEAARLVNTAIERFLAYHVERRRTDIQRDIASLGERVVIAQQDLSAARQTYDEFRRENNITDLSTEQEAAIAQAAQLRSQADLGRAEVESLEARVTQLRGELGRTSRTTAVSGGASDEQVRLRQLRQQLTEARGQGLGDDHPRVQSLQRQVSALERAGGSTPSESRSAQNPVYAQIASSLQSAETELEATRHRVATLEQLAVRAQERTVRFSDIEGRAATLLAQVNVRQALLNELNETRAGLEDQVRDVNTGFRLVAEARPPEFALPSKKKYAVAFGIPAAFVVIMIAMLMFRELRGLTVQTAKEVAFWGNGPVIGSTTWPRDPKALLDLIADLDDFAPDARGTLLVVGSTEAEIPLAREFASQLNHDWTTSTHVSLPALPANTRTSRASQRASYYDDSGDEVLSGEIYDGPTEVALPTGTELALLDFPTEIEQPGDVDALPDRLICTAWGQRPEGQALRRAARLADRVLVVVSSGGVRATELAAIRTRLGVEDNVGYVLTGVSDDISKLPDRAGDVAKFWHARAR
ncbi:MAG: hypothetical protein KF729_19175 [Sandaracinaceae bacterium]|nr:hypothetical protein [Sandaracinaceae bacterium]